MQVFWTRATGKMLNTTGPPIDHCFYPACLFADRTFRKGTEQKRTGKYQQRLLATSSDEAVFNKTVPKNQTALQQSGYTYRLKHQPKTPRKNTSDREISHGSAHLDNALAN